MTYDDGFYGGRDGMDPRQLAGSNPGGCSQQHHNYVDPDYDDCQDNDFDMDFGGDFGF